MSIVSVAAKNKSYLQKALERAGLGVALGAGRMLGADAYNKVKAYLVSQNIPFKTHSNTSTVPSDHVHH